ncbi:sulfurtransferase TusA family protein [Desulfobacula sp.]|uniref:sulfurtransferase TusA family protein n=1 Tax=Desulfobacula sp. TaxID=2593537 RepID=UPI00262E3B22|nr:sulfurtransferase TusA family protein [Desulfobacula sp.]
MTSKIRLDLRGVISPLNLLKCKSRLKSMEKGEILEVMLADRDVVKDLIIIVKRSNDEVIYTNEADDGICLGIQKGSRSYNHKDQVTRTSYV